MAVIVYWAVGRIRYFVVQEMSYSSGYGAPFAEFIGAQAIDTTNNENRWETHFNV